MNIYVIFDRKAETVQSVFTGDNDVSAIRAVVNAAKNPGTTLADFPAEFELQMVGFVDIKTSKVEGLTTPSVIGLISNLLAAANQEPPKLKVSDDQS